MVTVLPPGVVVTVYPVIADPPSVEGASQETTAAVLRAVAVTPVGAVGIVLGVTAELAGDAGEVPTALAAVTVNVYAVPLVRPVTVAVVIPVVATVMPPGAAVTVYPVIADPPSVADADHDTTAWVLPAVAETPPGADGVCNAGTTEADGADDGLVPTPLVAVTVKV